MFTTKVMFTTSFYRIDPDGKLLGFRADRWKDISKQVHPEGCVRASAVEAVRALFVAGDTIQNDDTDKVWDDFDQFAKDCVELIAR